MRKSVEDRMEGAIREGKGKIKQETGRITRNRSMQAEGFVEKHAGKIQRAAGRARSESKRR